MYDYSAAKLAVDEPTPWRCGAVDYYIRFTRENQLLSTRQSMRSIFTPRLKNANNISLFFSTNELSVRYIQNTLLLTWLVKASLRYERSKKCPTFLPLSGLYNLWQFFFSNVMANSKRPLFVPAPHSVKQMVGCTMKCMTLVTRVKSHEGIQPMLFYCWCTVYATGPILKQYWFNISCLLGWFMPITANHVTR